MQSVGCSINVAYKYLKNFANYETNEIDLFGKLVQSPALLTNPLLVDFIRVGKFRFSALDK